MLYLLRKPVIVLIIFGSFCSTGLFAQKELNRSEHDNLPYYFGIYLAYNRTFLHPTKHPYFLQTDSVLTAEPNPGSGVALGFLATFKPSDRWEFRLNPSLIIGGKKSFTYDLLKPDAGESYKEVQTFPSSIFTFPAQFKFNSDRINNFRVYLMFDGYVSKDLMAKAGTRNSEDFVKLRGGDYGIETAIGFNFYLEFVTLSPELKFTYGMNNLHARDPNLKFSSVFDKLQSRMITLSLNIEQ